RRDWRSDRDVAAGSLRPVLLAALCVERLRPQDGAEERLAQKDGTEISGAVTWREAGRVAAPLHSGTPDYGIRGNRRHSDVHLRVARGRHRYSLQGRPRRKLRPWR